MNIWTWILGWLLLVVCIYLIYREWKKEWFPDIEDVQNDDL